MSVIKWCITAIVMGGVHAVLPQRCSHYELAGEIFFENLDYLGSIQYAYTSVNRAFVTPYVARVCSDGLEVEPVLQHQCPLPTAASQLKPCSSVGLGEVCTDAQDCGWAKPANNCPVKSVYQKVEKSCRGRGAAFCLGLSKAIATVSVFTVGLAVFIVGFFVPVAAGYPHFFFVIPAGVVIYLSVTWPVLWAVGGTTGMIVFGVMIGIAAIAVWLIVFLVATDKGSGDETFNRLVCLTVPVLNIYVSWRMGANAALAVRDIIKPFFVCVRIIDDIPEVICNILDLYFFGISWSALFDLITSTLQVFYHLTWQVFRCMKAAISQLDDYIGAPPHATPEEDRATKV